MNVKFIAYLLLIILLLYSSLVITSSQQVNNHWLTTHTIGVQTRYYDVFVDIPISSGGTGLIFLVGEVDNHPLITALNPDGSINWSRRYNVNGSAYTVTKRIGVYAAPDNLVFVGGEVLSPNQSALFMVVNAYNGNVLYAWNPSEPGAEGDRVNDLIIGPGGDVYGVGTVFTNMDPSNPYNTLFFRYHPENDSILYSIAYIEGTGGTALDTYNNYIYLAERNATDIIVREVEYGSGNTLRGVDISKGVSIIAYDIEVTSEGIFLVGAEGATLSNSQFIALYNNMSIKNVYSHTERIWRELEVGDDNRVYVFGDGRRYIVYPTNYTRDLELTWFLTNVSGRQYVERYIIGTSEEEYSGGFHIRDYGYISGYIESFPQESYISGLASLFSTNISNMTWLIGCSNIENITVHKVAARYFNLARYYNATNISKGHIDLSTVRISVSSVGVSPSTCTAVDSNKPTVIPEFHPILLLALPIIYIVVAKKFLHKVE